ncbi:hypothetical protein JTB14_007490 [Gonioctena quinquepunctata]|nr:hypothetical protein JTB14_007490 [Gonioctena quinquepunctata]
MSFRELLTEKQLEEKAARIMNGEDDDPESFDDSELDEDNNSAARLIQQAFSPIQSEEEIEPRLDGDILYHKQAQKYSFHQNVSATTEDELKALFGVLILSAAKKDNHLSARHMFDSTISGKFYRSCMNCDRFLYLLNCIRCDDKETREERKINDPFTHIREIWEILIDTCRHSYSPTSYVTIDEQLLAFRGRCPFRMYIPNKPAKYGVKIVMLCDSATKYMSDASPYLGKKTETNGLPLADSYVKELTKSIHGTNRNVTMDNWFTSVPLVDELLQSPYKLTMIGTIRKNEKEITKEFLDEKSRNAKTSMICFDQKKTLVSYMPKKKKLVLLLSTMHGKAEIQEETGICLAKPWMQHRYNSKTLCRYLRQDILGILKENVVNTPQDKKRKTCYYCPSKKRRMTTNYCMECKNPICGEHRGDICTVCCEK